MKLTKEISEKINEAWQYGAASSCRYAMNELDKFVNELLKGKNIEIQNENLIINDLKEFLIWKNKNWVFQQITICNNLSIEEKVDLINDVVSKFNLTQIKFTEIDTNNHYFNARLSNNNDLFQVYLGKMTKMNELPNNTINVESVKFYKNSELYLKIMNGKSYTFSFQKLEIK